MYYIAGNFRGIKIQAFLQILTYPRKQKPQKIYLENLFVKRGNH